MVERFNAPGPWITRDLKPCVRASDYDSLAFEHASVLVANRLLIERDAILTAQIQDLKRGGEALLRAVETFKAWHANAENYEAVLGLLTQASKQLRAQPSNEGNKLADQIDAALGSTSSPVPGLS